MADLSLTDLLIIAGLFAGGFFLTWMFTSAMKERDRPKDRTIDRQGKD